MLKNALIALLFLITGNCFAQQTYFVSIQSDNNQPFYARVHNETLNSTETGRLVIPQLKDSTYELSIGFSNNSSPEQHFAVATNKKDQNFVLKNITGKGWGLFNSLTSELNMSTTPASTNENVAIAAAAPPKKEDAFARMMAGVVNDTAIMHEHIVEPEEQPKKQPTVVDVAKNKTAKHDSAVAKNVKGKDLKAKKITDAKKQPPENAVAKNITPLPDSAKTNEEKVETVQPLKTEVAKDAPKIEKKENKIVDSVKKNVAKTKQPLYRPKDTVVRKKTSFIKQLSEQKTDSTFQVKFVDIPDKGAIDTVDVSIPLNDATISTATKQEVAKKIPEVQLPREEKIVKKDDSINPSTDSAVPMVSKKEEMRTSDTMNKTAAVVTNKNCKNFATDYDIDKLRVKMLSLSTDDDKIAAGKTVFKIKCFTVKQVRALSEMFRTDAGKYQFFDAAYPFVADSGNFAQLQELLSDPYYLNRFKAMIR